MPNPPRTVFIDVFIKELNPLDFDVLPSPKNDPQLPTNANPAKPGQPEIIFHNHQHAGFKIYFELQGDTKGYFFPPNSDKHNAVWSKCGSDCPTETGVWEVFKPLQVVEPNPAPQPGQPAERRTLVVNNPNPTATPTKPAQGKFKYNLRVTNGRDWLDLDPGGDNSNGGYGFTSLSYATVATIAATTAILSAIATTATLKFSNLLVCPGVTGP